MRESYRYLSGKDENRDDNNYSNDDKIEDDDKGGEIRFYVSVR